MAENTEPALNMKSGEAQLELTVHVTRKDTGLTETYKLTGTPEPVVEEKKEQ